MREGRSSNKNKGAKQEGNNSTPNKRQKQPKTQYHNYTPKQTNQQKTE